MKNKSPKAAAIILLLMSLATFKSNAQSDILEVGLRMSSFQGFGAIYKKQLSENTYNRISAAAAQLNVASNSRLIRLGLSLGREKRQQIGSQTYFVHGFNPFFALNLNNLEQ